jgi:hypothetical protein
MKPATPPKTLSRSQLIDLAFHNLARRHKVSAAQVAAHLAALTNTKPKTVAIAIHRLRHADRDTQPSVWLAAVARALNLDLAIFEPSPAHRAELERRGYHIGFIPVIPNLPYGSLLAPDA